MELELRGITKRFGPVTANDHINLEIKEGHIHALLGENGAGKSTLMNILYGLHQPDEGEILIDGKPVKISGPGDAVAAGIGMVHQHFMLIPVFTVAESLVLGDEPTGRAGLINVKEARRRVEQVSADYGFELDPDVLIEDLPVGLQQRVEIAKALVREAKVLILDEPTAVLTPQETDELMATMRKLADAGTSIVFITHKLREVRAVADEITVIRRGRVVGSATPDTSEADLATMMVGRPVMLQVQKEAPHVRENSLKVSHLSAFDAGRKLTLDNVSFEVRGGEVLGIAGVEGNGQTSLARAILGLEDPASGTISLDGHDITHASPRKSLDAGVGFIPEDRTRDGIVASFSVAANLVLDRYRDAPFARHGELQRTAVRHEAERATEEYDIRVGAIEDPIATLSGGNQQKVVVARELSRGLKLLVANQPTRGVDVGSVEFIHNQIIAVRDRGVPVLVISSELDEVTQLSDRVAVMYRGKIVGIVPPSTPSEVLGLMMAGVPASEALAGATKEEMA
ncbi:ABC transporter ATP-binding protein [Neoactinobaculum massilliense]|uniref:ABC transporter ATP-binding protein n=1 Tax=Neoactinobaculum massilliense TaxID=2364794 RepID=UPI000F51F3A8|nr:ABC transporter ATP-binding protein [Neoactinobaculum massilliense]